MQYATTIGVKNVMDLSIYLFLYLIVILFSYLLLLNINIETILLNTLKVEKFIKTKMSPLNKMFCS